MDRYVLKNNSPNYDERIFKSVRKACNFAGISKSLYYKRLKNKQDVFPAVCLPGTRPFFRAQAIIEWLESHERVQDVQGPHGIALENYLNNPDAKRPARKPFKPEQVAFRKAQEKRAQLEQSAGGAS